MFNLNQVYVGRLNFTVIAELYQQQQRHIMKICFLGTNIFFMGQSRVFYCIIHFILRC